MKKLLKRYCVIAAALAHFTSMAQPGNGSLNIDKSKLLPIQEIRLVQAKPNDVFSTSFATTATGRNDMNAYLLCYLSTLIYPDYISYVSGNEGNTTYINRLHNNPNDFEAEFKKYIAPLFTNPDIEFFHKSDRLGYDPEAVVISNANAIYVIFRGTDRVGSNRSGLAFDWAEWISTDFDARQITTPHHTGKVLAGMWGALDYEGFKDDVYNYIVSKGGQTKKVWVAGHSLGAGQAQLYAMFMAKKGITPQGVYGFAAPNPGNQQFANEMDRLFPNNRLQRFDFISDPITVLAQVVGCTPAGTRVFYNDINTIEFNKNERNPAEFLAIIPGVVGAVGNALADFITETSGRRLNLDVLVLGNSTMCYHHPTWYLRSAYQQLTASQRAKVPAPLHIPESGQEACDKGTVERGKKINLFDITTGAVLGFIEDRAAEVEATLKTIQFAASSIIDNVTGSAIAEGDYYIKSYASNSRLGLNEQNGMNNGSDMRLTESRSNVTVKRFGAVGYTLKFGTKTVTKSVGFGPAKYTWTETKEMVLDSEGESLFNNGSSEIQLWEKNNVPGISANQRWLFIRLEGDKYLIKNLANGKLLDANNANINTNSCGVKTYGPVNNDQTQIWVMEKR